MNRGFSLVQVLISIGLLGIIFLAGFKIFESQTKLGKSSSFVFESMVVLDEIKSLLSDPLSCKATFAGKSSYYEEIAVINRYDHINGRNIPEYEIMKREKKANKGSDGLQKTKPKGENKVYGQDNILLKSIAIHGDSNGFESVNNYSLVKVTFQEYGGHKEYVGVFPLRVRSNQSKRIESCEASPGLHSDSGVHGSRGPWVRSMDDNQEFALFTGESVKVGRVDSRARLGVEGGALFWASKKEEQECTDEREGALIYFQDEDNLFTCRDEVWSPLSKREEVKGEGKDFLLKGTGDQLVKGVTKKKYSYCLLKSMKGAQGECLSRAAPSQAQGQKSLFNLLLRATPGYALECTFTCY